MRVCIATDSPASTPSFDMFDEMRAAIVGARAREGRPDALTAGDALELATLGGARALGIDDAVGSLVPGKQADLTVLSLADTSFIPWEDPVTGTVLGGTPQSVVATLVSGKPRYEKGGKTWLELIDAARRARGRLLQDADPQVVIEDTMFFPRLRRHAKWMFLFLALALGLGFVLFGIGAGGHRARQPRRRRWRAADVPSVSDAEERVLDNPKDAAAFRDLATAHQAAGNTDEAIEAMASFIALKPRNTDALRELAALYLQQATTAQERAQIYQAAVRLPRPGLDQGHDLPAQRQPSHAGPDHERRQHVVRPGDLGRGVGNPDCSRPGRRAVSTDRRDPAEGSRPCSSSSPRPPSRRTTRRP